MSIGTFNSDKTLYGEPKYIPLLGERICLAFSSDGYQVTMERLADGGVDISLTKGGLFKSIVGMQSALKINLMPEGENIHIKAGVGIFGQQAIPTAVALLVAWPVMIAQIWGMIQQSQMDDRAIALAESELHKLKMGLNGGDSAPSGYDGPTVSADENGGKYCKVCGAKMDANARFCSACGGKL